MIHDLLQEVHVQNVTKRAEYLEEMNVNQSVFSAPLESSGSGGAGGGSGERTRDEIVDEIAAQIQSRMPGAFDVEAVSMMYPLSYNESMNTVLVQELMRYNNIIVEMNNTLPQLRKALKGLVVMSVELEAMANALETQGIPPNWQRHAYPSLKPLSPWFDEFIQRRISSSLDRQWYSANILAPRIFLSSSFLYGNQTELRSKETYPDRHVGFRF